MTTPTDYTILSPPQPMDHKTTRPPLDLASVATQIWMIQTFLAMEREKKTARKELNVKG
ncbi:MAG TPA: hypothetical protein VMQ76_05290 [Terracidiphilus sp.]|nr:hypothetical protein [Terracidiphilus sp.]